MVVMFMSNANQIFQSSDDRAFLKATIAALQAKKREDVGDVAGAC